MTIGEKFFIIPLPTLEDYPYPPYDQPGCTSIKCPYCQKPSWLSAKKRRVINEGIKQNIKVIFACHSCIVETPEEFLMNQDGSPSFVIL